MSHNAWSSIVTPFSSMYQPFQYPVKPQPVSFNLFDVFEPDTKEDDAPTASHDLQTELRLAH